MSLLKYWIDRHGTIRRVEGPWDAMLAGSVCTAEAVVGRQLTSFVAGPGVLEVYLRLHEQVAGTGRSVSISWRCDTPDTRRDVELRISKDGDGLRYDSAILAEAPLVRQTHAAAPSGQEIVTVCSFCMRARLERGWSELEVFPWPACRRDFEISHGICPDCLARIGVGASAGL